MPREGILRRALWVSVPFNLIAALLFAFPASWLGELAGLPAEIAPVYRALLAFFVAMFAGLYAWLASQPQIPRPFVIFAAIGKAGVFALVLMFWFVDGAPGRTLILASGDLVLAAIFAWGAGPEGRGATSRSGRTR